MKIEVWSDYICPFCYIGKRRLEQALEGFEHKDQVKVSFKAFELQPHLPSDPNISLDEMLAKKMNVSVEQAQAMNQQMIANAATVGLAYNFDHMKQTNTRHAHRLVKFAETQEKAAALTERLLSAHFTESKYLGDREVLLDLAEEVGLDRSQSKEVLQSDAFLDEVLMDQQEAQQLGVQGVPFFVLNRKYAISGAQPLDTFVKSLEKVWEEENQPSPLEQLQISTESRVCTDDSCDIKN